MYTWNEIIRVFLCLTLLSNPSGIFSQQIIKYPLPDSIHPVDLITLGNQMHLVGARGIYQMENGHFNRLAFSKALLVQSSDNPGNKQKFHFYPQANGGQSGIGPGLMIRPVKPFLEKGVITSSGSFIYHADEVLSLVKDDSLLNISSPSLSPGYWDVARQDEYTWWAHFGSGLYKVAHGEILNHLTKDQGLADNKCISVYADGTTVWTGHKGSVSEVTGQGNINIIELQTARDMPVIEIEKIRNRLWFLTPDQLFGMDTDGVPRSFLNATPGSEFLAIQSDNYGRVVILGSEAVYTLDTGIEHSVPLENNTSNNINLYRIRNKLYYTNGEMVYSYNNITGLWTSDPDKYPPENITTDTSGNTWLIFDDESILLDRENATIISIIPHPHSISDVTALEPLSEGSLIGTSEGLYYYQSEKTRKLNTSSEHIYNIVKIGTDSCLIFGEHSVDLFSEKDLNISQPGFPERYYPPSTNQYKDSVWIITFTSSSLVLYNLENGQVHEVHKGLPEIHDIINFQGSLYLLKAGQLVRADKDRLLTGDFRMEATWNIPFSNGSSTAWNFEDSLLYVSGKDTLVKLNLQDGYVPEAPEVELLGIELANGERIFPSNNKVTISKSSLPVTLSFAADRKFGTDQRFVFHAGSGSSFQTSWTSDGKFLFDPPLPGKYHISAAIKSDIAAPELYTRPVIIEVRKSGTPAGMIILWTLLSLLLLIFIILVTKKVAKG